MQKLLTNLCKKFQHICVSLHVNFNDSLTNGVVSFEQLGPELYWLILDLKLHQALGYQPIHSQMKVITSRMQQEKKLISLKGLFVCVPGQTFKMQLMLSRLAPVVFVLYLFLSFSTLFFFLS